MFLNEFLGVHLLVVSHGFTRLQVTGYETFVLTPFSFGDGTQVPIAQAVFSSGIGNALKLFLRPGLQVSQDNGSRGRVVFPSLGVLLHSH